MLLEGELTLWSIIAHLLLMSFMTSTRGVGRENDLFMSLNFRSAVFFLIS